MSKAFKIAWVRCDTERGAMECNPGSQVIISPEGYQFLWVYQGDVACRNGRKACRLGPESIALVRPGQVVKCEFGSAEPQVVFTFTFGVQGLPESWQDPGSWPFWRKMPHDDVIRPLFEYVIAHGGGFTDHPAPSLNHAIQTMMSTFISGRVARPNFGVNLYPVPIWRVLQWAGQFLCRSPNQKVTLADLADIAGVSPKYLCRVFHEHIGCGPIELIYQVRVTRSLIGLKAGQKIETLACDLGFANAAHYSRRFKSLFGKTPCEMRKAISEGYKPKLPDLPLMGR